VKNPNEKTVGERGKDPGKHARKEQLESVGSVELMRKGRRLRGKSRSTYQGEKISAEKKGDQSE